MFTRRDFLGAAGAGLIAAPLAWSAQPEGARRKKMAIVSTVWRYHSHAQHMGDRFLVGYPMHGKWHRPELDVVSLYADQQPPEADLSRPREQEFKFKIYPTIAETLRCGGDKLAVDAVLIIGEHGEYPLSEFGQTKYPRYEFFKQVTDVFREDGRAVPVFNDKHLSWNWEWAVEMVDTAHALKFPFMAGSSLPGTWRMPAVDLPWGAEVDEVMCVAIGGPDSYDFHALEVIQCMAERRRGGETGVAWIQALRGDAVWKAMEAGSWDAGGFSRPLFEACLSRSQTLAPPRSGFTHRYPTDAEIRQLEKDPIAYRFQYNDGLKATMLLMNGVVGDFTFAAKLKEQAEPLSTLFYLPPNPNVTYSAILMSNVEKMFLTGKAVYPVERTLLTTGLVAAAMKSLASGQKRIEMPGPAVRYQVSQESTFCQS
ncbi:MAG: twin-arginine translocation signal domain-containing protein [Planctomycetaceae bacterium]